MSGKTLELLITALKEEVERLRLKPAYQPKPTNDRPGPWCSREQAMRYFSLPKGRLEEWVKEGRVIAKKFDPLDPNSAIRFKTADIDAAYEQMPDYKFETKRQMHTVKNGEIVK